MNNLKPWPVTYDEMAERTESRQKQKSIDQKGKAKKKKNVKL